MLCPKEERGARRWGGSCPDCGGCIDDQCGGCGRRFCGGTYAWMQWGADTPEDQSCDRCPKKVDSIVMDDLGREHLIMVRCNGAAGHSGGCNENPARVGY